MIKVDVKADIQEVETGLKELGLELRGIGRKILRALATLTKKRVKKRMGLYLNRRTYGFSLTGSLGGKLKAGDYGGGLFESVYGFARSAEHAVVSSGKRWQAEALERGADLKPTKSLVFSNNKFNKGMLYFMGDSGFKKMHEVEIPAKKWFSRSVEGFENDPEYQSTIDKTVGKAIKKAMKT